MRTVRRNPSIVFNSLRGQTMPAKHIRKSNFHMRAMKLVLRDPATAICCAQASQPMPALGHICYHEVAGPKLRSDALLSMPGYRRSYKNTNAKSFQHFMQVLKLYRQSVTNQQVFGSSPMSRGCFHFKQKSSGFSEYFSSISKAAATWGIHPEATKK